MYLAACSSSHGAAVTWALMLEQRSGVRSRSDTDGASRRSQHSPLDRTRVRLGGELAAAVNLVPCAPVPTFLFLVLRDGGP